MTGSEMLRMGQNPLSFISKPQTVGRGGAVLVTTLALLVGEPEISCTSTWVSELGQGSPDN